MSFDEGQTYNNGNLSIHNVTIKYKGTLYITKHIYSVTQDEDKPKRPINAYVGFAVALIVIWLADYYFRQQPNNAIWIVLAGVSWMFLTSMYRRIFANVTVYKLNLHIKDQQEPVQLEFTKEEERNNAYIRIQQTIENNHARSHI
ncbi:hypothetical protein MUG87_11405 [Ectobacillus sp. JY-23]|uniref:hypothetical protein n=1 Tax=Ectobacillus sp. JY-23 TaxID=2933872 RepID=UPI001FF17BF2|nr:hypothetical protein [Ectobacillus sp. JY-23]UOY91167.1 hypothetical protein MUG87_11405 [Ectobacillus sp. JY-23]